MYNIPILLLVFNRPKNIKKIIKVLEKIKPTKIYISSDGPRKNNLYDEILCRKTKDNLLKIRWKCSIKKKYLISNQGCRKAVSNGISWFFKNENHGIILEDDCIPNLDFFKFCSINLKKYENSKKIGTITGNNFQKKTNIKETYYYSKYPHCWGWATWRRSWKIYNKKISFWPYYKNTNKWKNFFSSSIEQRYWTKIFNQIYKRKIDSWAYPWSLCLWKNNLLTITPSMNLVKNIGFGKGATHTTSKQDDQKYKLNKLPKKWQIPKNVHQNTLADEYVFKNHFKGKNYLWPYRFLFLIKILLTDPKKIYYKIINILKINKK